MMAKREKFKLDYKYYIFLIIFLIILIAFLCIVFDSSLAENANGHLDQIEEYTIKIAPRLDGTLDMIYHIRWKVLDDKKDGPLTWVKIGIPNSHVDDVISGSAHIKDIRYYKSGGDYVRIDFFNKYYAGDSVDIDFSIHQSYMYTLEGDDICAYYFTAGWFDEIDVDKVTIYWRADDVIESDNDSTYGEFLVWKKSLPAGNKISTVVKYNTSAFSELNSKMQKSNAEQESRTILIIVIVGVAIFAIIVFLIAHHDDDYHSGSGFGSGGDHYVHVIHAHPVRSSCACVSSCACACACAGGGRAGCSKKDFYSKKNANIKDIQKVLEK